MCTGILWAWWSGTRARDPLTARAGHQGPRVGGGEPVVVGAPRKEDVGTVCAIPEPSSSQSHEEPKEGALHSIS